MPNAAHVGISANTENRLVFDAGALYRDYGEAGQALIGATRGGATWTVEREKREIEVDGARGPIKGLTRIVREDARLEVELLEMSKQTWLDITGASDGVSDGTHETITPSLAIAAADYYTNIALVADVSGSGDPCILKLLNALSRETWSIGTTDRDEGRLSVMFRAHYGATTVETPPYQILWPVGAS